VPSAVDGFAAVRLFVDRARATDPAFRLTDDNAEAVADICRRLDGLPLAIELAAARLRLFSPETLRARLTSRLEVLRSSARDLPVRHQTLRATIEWSVQLLEPDEQRLFDLMSVFADADLAGVEAVAAGPTDVDDLDMLDALGSLIDKSLVRRVDAPGGEPRFSMLETVRELAAERLANGGRREVAQRAHAAFYTDAAVRLRGELDTPGRDQAIRELVAEAGNLRIAVRTWADLGDVSQLSRLANALLVLNEVRGWYHDTVDLTTTLLSVLAATPASPELAGQEIGLRLTLARAIMATQGFTAEGERAYEAALARFEGQPELHQHYSILRGLANLYMLRSAFPEARRLGERLLELSATDADPAIAIDGHLVVGATMLFMGSMPDGLAHLEAAIARFERSPEGRIGAKVGNDPRVACLTTSAFAHWMLGMPDTAVDRADAAIELARRIDHPYTSAYALFHSGLLHLWRREPEVVLDRAVRMLEVADTFDLRIWLAIGHCLQGAAQARLGKGEAGLAALRSGLGEYRGLITPPVFWPMLLWLDAGASDAAGRPAEGLVPANEAIELMGRGSTAMPLAEIEMLRGDLLAAMGEPALPAWRDALDSARRIAIPMSELRALTRLVRASAGVERQTLAGELRAVLAGVTEGRATPDIREAEAALAEAS
jgi:tetratricopeptide (TPR) repeat protein